MAAWLGDCKSSQQVYLYLKSTLQTTPSEPPLQIACLYKLLKCSLRRILDSEDPIVNESNHGKGLLPQTSFTCTLAKDDNQFHSPTVQCKETCTTSQPPSALARSISPGGQTQRK